MSCGLDDLEKKNRHVLQCVNQLVINYQFLCAPQLRTKKGHTFSVKYIVLNDL